MCACAPAWAYSSMIFTRNTSINSRNFLTFPLSIGISIYARIHNQTSHPCAFSISFSYLILSAIVFRHFSLDSFCFYLSFFPTPFEFLFYLYSLVLLGLIPSISVFLLSFSLLNLMCSIHNLKKARWSNAQGGSRKQQIECDGVCVCECVKKEYHRLIYHCLFMCSLFCYFFLLLFFALFCFIHENCKWNGFQWKWKLNEARVAEIKRNPFAQHRRDKNNDAAQQHMNKRRETGENRN